MALHIIKSEGIGGLYRGFFMSILTYAPSSAVWWGTLSLTKRTLTSLLSHTYPSSLPPPYPEEEPHLNLESMPITPSPPLSPPPPHPETPATLVITALSGLTAGVVSALMTNPMDVIKTRVQTMRLREGGGGARERQWRVAYDAAKHLAGSEGWRGFYRGVGARIASVGPTSIMLILTYDVVKRLSMIEE
ncbi:hypothetical protein HDV00_001140 [Rhizophlyctis rosea]|nr:hypothetical protein HDV00_001140 [Rhizophlyctis rosea]